MDGFLASRSFRRSGKQLDRKSSLLLTPSLTSTRRAKLSICHNSSPGSTFPSSHSIFASAAPPPAGSLQHRAGTGKGWGLAAGEGHPASSGRSSVCRAARCRCGGRCPSGYPRPPRESPQPAAPARSLLREGCSLSLASSSPLFVSNVSACRYKGGFVMPPVCKSRGPSLTFRKTDGKCLFTVRADRTRAPGEGRHFSDRQRGSHGSTTKGLLAACLPRNASCERLFSGERGGRWRGGLTLSLRAASRLPAARPSASSRAGPGLGAAPAGARNEVRP